MATTGAKVIHSRAVEVAAINHMPLKIQSSKYRAANNAKKLVYYCLPK